MIEIKAILLAAGRGTRISRYIDIPKSVLEVEGKPLIRRTAEILLSKGIDITVCIGYQQEKIKNSLKGLDIDYFQNPFFDITNSIGSLWFAKEKIKGTTIFINGDVYFDESLLDMLIASNHEATMLADKTRIHNGDYFFSINDGGLLEKYGKELTLENRTAEYVGMAKISADFVPKFVKRLGELVESQKHDFWWEDVLYSFVGEEDIATIDVDGKFWAEIDYLDDYERILNHISSVSRVYDKKIAINADEVCSFYDNRALRYNELGMSSVLLGDQDKALAEQWNEYERDNIAPKLKIDKNSKVLDIGCGIGRWAKICMPIANSYCGTDFSNEMISLAKNISSHEHAEFLNLSFSETVNHAYPEKFNTVIIAGLCMYVNDNELKGNFKSLVNLLEEYSIIYLTETVGLNKRFTLNNFYSDNLKAKYNVIYRTTEEYNDYYQIFLDNGFEIVEQSFLPKLNDDEKFSETNRYYTILKRSTRQ